MKKSCNDVLSHFFPIQLYAHMCSMYTTKGRRGYMRGKVHCCT